ncbi:MAG: hypothetical protein RL194_625 [Pseudomonadota bacterium]|jgi:hypothetical protein
MSESSGCEKIQVANAHGCRIYYCQTHQVAELEIGAISIRLDIEAYAALSGVMQQSHARIAVLNQTQSIHDDLFRRLGRSS